MDNTKKKELLKKLQAHRQAFTMQLPEKLKKIEGYWHSLAEEPWSKKTASNLHHMAHSLSGSSGTFGLPQVGEAAHALEILLTILNKAGTPPTEQQRQAIQQRLDALSAVIQESLAQDCRYRHI